MINEFGIILAKAVARRIRKEFPQVTEVYLVGSRSRGRTGEDMDMVAVVPNTKRLPGDRRNERLVTDGLQVDIFFSRPGEVESHLLEYGLGMDIVRWKKAAIAKGLKLNRFGLWRSESKITGKMANIAGILGMKLKPHLVAIRANPL